jgi:hypothetical protein
VSLSLDEAATLTVRLERKAKRRFRPVGAGRVFRRGGRPEHAAQRDPQVRPGRYRVTVVATDAAGNRSQARLAFRRR